MQKLTACGNIHTLISMIFMIIYYCFLVHLFGVWYGFSHIYWCLPIFFCKDDFIFSVKEPTLFYVNLSLLVQTCLNHLKFRSFTFFCLEKEIETKLARVESVGYGWIVAFHLEFPSSIFFLFKTMYVCF